MAKSVSNQTTAYLLIEVPAKNSGDVARRLVDEYRQFVTETHAVWGEADVIAKVSVSNPSVLADLVMRKIQKMTHVKGTRTFITIDGMHYTGDVQIDDSASDVDAFLFISVDASRSEEIANLLVDQFSGSVIEAHAVWGGADVIARVRAQDMTRLSELVMSSIQNVQYVSVTRTYLLIPGFSEYSHNTKDS